ncbi:MAG: hypothetical protein Q8L48_23895 [Archangium sp.]|nr:hypothetical protein [Archangium sp.]
MGHHVDFHRVPRAALAAAVSPEQRAILTGRQVTIEPGPDERAGEFLARWIEKDGWCQAQAELFRALPGAQSFDGWDRDASQLPLELGLIAQRSADPRLRFLHRGAARADWQAHLDRLPHAARRLASNGDVVCLAAEETRALSQVERSQWEDLFPHLATPPPDDAVEVLHAYGDGDFVLSEGDWPEEYRDEPWVAAPTPSTLRVPGEAVSSRVMLGVLAGGVGLLVLSAWFFGGC